MKDDKLTYYDEILGIDCTLMAAEETGFPPRLVHLYCEPERIVGRKKYYRQDHVMATFGGPETDHDHADPAAVAALRRHHSRCN
jgi:hypothetical protein